MIAKIIVSENYPKTAKMPAKDWLLQMFAHPLYAILPKIIGNPFHRSTVRRTLNDLPHNQVLP